VLRAVFFPERAGDPFEPPKSFIAWLNDAAQDDFVGKATIEKLKKMQMELYEMGSDLMHEAHVSGARPDFKIYDEFINLYDDLVYQLRRLEHDAVQADTGLDVGTGLRSKKAMVIDLEREMERRARRGKPFCLALAKIDNYEQIIGLMTEERHREVIAAVARLIKKCIRSFDDAYRPLRAVWDGPAAANSGLHLRSRRAGGHDSERGGDDGDNGQGGQDGTH
jgi:GGDEF domain-containing protein